MLKNKVTVNTFLQKKKTGEKITILTAYDAEMARILDECGIDAVLVGDSLGMVVLGYDSTLQVTMDEMIHHARAARRGVKRALLIGDMPFMSYQASKRDAVHNAGRFLKEALCEAVKLEGGQESIPAIWAIIAAGIPVMGHLGLTPQSVNKFGGYTVQGRDKSKAKEIMEDAILLEKAGCFAVTLECVPAKLAKDITAKLKIPTIGIGAGKFCDGEVLVTHDMIGYFDKFTPKFVKQYAKVGFEIRKAVKKFKADTESGKFPQRKHSF